MKKNITQILITFRKTPESITLTTAFNKEYMSKHSTELLINKKKKRNKRKFYFSKNFKWGYILSVLGFGILYRKKKKNEKENLTSRDTPIS